MRDRTGALRGRPGAARHFYCLREGCDTVCQSSHLSFFARAVARCIRLAGGAYEVGPLLAPAPGGVGVGQVGNGYLAA